MSTSRRSLLLYLLAACMWIGVLVVLSGCGGSTESLAASGPSGASGLTAANGLPTDFLGIVSDDAFAAAPKLRAEVLAGERHSGVELIRRTFDWPALEPKRGHFDFSYYDGYMTSTAQAGIQVLPVLFGRPAWEPGQAPKRGAKISATTTTPPRSNSDFAAFAVALVRRYGPGGSFWRAHPKLPARPIVSWQVWNEPNLPVYWGGTPNAASYVAMLKTVGSAIKAIAPSAEIVTAGIPDSTLGVPLQTYVKQIIAAGGGNDFDTLAINPYAATSGGVVAAVGAVRRVLNTDGLTQTPIWLTEIGWSSGGPGSSFTVGPTLQARYILDAITTLASLAPTLRIRGVVYFDWRDATPYPGTADFWGLHTGLLSLNGAGKLALSAYYQAAGVIGALPSGSG